MEQLTHRQIREMLGLECFCGENLARPHAGETVECSECGARFTRALTTEPIRVRKPSFAALRAKGGALTC